MFNYSFHLAYLLPGTAFHVSDKGVWIFFFKNWHSGFKFKKMIEKSQTPAFSSFR